MNNFLHDLRVAFRTLRKNPGFTLVVVLSIALGIGANTTVYTWMDNVLFNPFPMVRASGTLVALNPVDQNVALRGMPPVAYVDYVDWRAQLQSFTDVALHSIQRVSMRADSDAQGEPVWTQITTGNYFSTLELQPQLGRFFTREDEAARAPVVVLSHAFWQRRFGGDRAIIGRHIRLNGADLTVIGIGPQKFFGIMSALSFDMWVPVWAQREIIPAFDWMNNRSVQRMQAFARLKPGVTTMLQTNEGPRVVVVEKVGESVVDVDLNHPLAGKTLNFALEVIEVRAATAEEIAHGHVHGPGGHHH